MSLQYTVLVGYANGDVHSMQIMEGQEASLLATEEAKEIGRLTNAGFRTVVASAWLRKETKTAGLLYAAAWQENLVEVILHYGDRVASSHDLYTHLNDEHLEATDLLRFCRQLKID